MSRNELIAYVAAILTTLRDLATDCAESTLYLTVGMDIVKWELLKGVLTGSGLVTISGYRVSLTPKGIETADKCNAVLASAK